MMHFPPPCFRFPPYFRKMFGLSEIFYNFTFSRKISSPSSAKISDDLFLVIDHKFRISPLFSLFQYISPLFRENYSFPPTFTNFPPCFRQIHLLFTYFTYFTCIFFPPYFDHDAFMHHPMHVLDAPDFLTPPNFHKSCQLQKSYLSSFSSLSQFLFYLFLSQYPLFLPSPFFQFSQSRRWLLEDTWDLRVYGHHVKTDSKGFADNRTLDESLFVQCVKDSLFFLSLNVLSNTKARLT